eukprot:PhM_4_TR15963/c0_g4_i5/m.45786
MACSQKSAHTIIFAFLVTVFFYCSNESPTTDSTGGAINPVPSTPLGLSSPRWRDDHGLDTYFSFLVRSGHHNQHLSVMYATTIAAELGISNLLVPHMCGRQTFISDYIRTKYLEMPVSDVYNVSEVVRLHGTMFGIDAHVITNNPGRKSLCGRSTVERELPPPRDGAAVAATLNLTFDGGAEIAETGSWSAWVETFWDRHEDDIRRQLVQVGVLREDQNVTDLPVVENGTNAGRRINIHVRAINHATWGMLSVNCKDTRYMVQGFCLRQPMPYSTFMRAALAWPYNRMIISSANNLQKRLGSKYGFFHLRAEADNIWSSRDYMFAQLKAAVERRPDMNWYVASGIFNPRMFNMFDLPKSLRPLVAFLHKVNDFRARRRWCSLVRRGQKCGRILVGDEINPSLSFIPVELRSCIDQLVGRGADVVAGLSQSSLMGV